MAEIRFNYYFEGLIKNILSLIYSKEKIYERYLFVLLIVGLVIRMVASNNMGFFADDAIYASQSAGIIDSGIISTHSHPPLFSYLTDLSFKIFGYNVLSSRLFSFIPGALLILVVYLLSLILFNNKKIALFSAFFATFSTFMIRMGFNEHSNLVFFFIFSATIFGLLYLKNRNLRNLFLLSLFFGLGMITKYNTAFFIMGFFIFSLVYLKISGEKIITKLNIKHLIIFSSILLLFCLPFLTFNYILYNENGIADFQFAMIFKPEKAKMLYSGLAGQDISFIERLFNINNYAQLSLIFRTDFILALFGLLGLYFLFRENRKRELYFLVSMFLLPFIVQSISSALTKHFLFILILFCIPAGFFLERTISKFNNKNLKIVFLIFLVIILFIHLGSNYGTPKSFLHKSGTSQLKDFISGEVKNGDLLVFDNRIYTALSFFLASPNNVLISSQVNDFMNFNSNLTNKKQTKVYFVECAKDDCGWGWVHTNPQLNSSSESFFDSIRNFSKKSTDIYFYNFEGNEFFQKKDKIIEYRVYTLYLDINPELLEQIKYIQNFYYVPYLYKDMNNYVFNYDYGGKYRNLHKLSRFIIFLSIILAFISFLYILWISLFEYRNI
jgi:hypothetical protein